MLLDIEQRLKALTLTITNYQQLMDRVLSVVEQLNNENQSLHNRLNKIENIHIEARFNALDAQVQAMDNAVTDHLRNVV